MAIFTPGPAISAASGSQGGTVFSRNRYGAYTRSRAIPVNPQTLPQQAARNRLAAFSTAWRGLTDAERLQWATWASQNPVVNALGAPQILAPNAAYIQLNTRIEQAGATPITAPPIGAAPDALDTLSISPDIGMGAFDVAWTPTPLAASQHLWTRAYVSNSVGVNYVTNLLRVVDISAAAATSPLDLQTAIEAVFGTLIVGQVIHLFGHVFDSATGLLSTPLRARGTVIST